MKTGCLVALCFLIAAGTGFAGAGNAAAVSKFKPAPRAQAHQPAAAPATTHNIGKPAARPLVKPRHIRLLPDLVVQKIWLDRSHIAFRIRNAGRGSIPENQHRRAKVKAGLKTYSLTVVDPKGLLKRPGRLVDYTTDIVPLTVNKGRSVAVTVSVDSTNQVHEQNEGNNTKTTRLFLAPLAHAAKRQSAVGRKTAFDVHISVEKIYQRDGTIHVRLHNRGKTHLTTAQLRRITMHLCAGIKTGAWHISDIDRGRHLLQPGGRFDFDTGVAISKPQRVTVNLTGLSGFKKGFRPAASKRLSPSWRKVEKPLHRSTGKSIGSKHIRDLPVTPTGPRLFGPAGSLAKHLHPAATPPNELLSLDIKIEDDASGKPMVEYDAIRNKIWVDFDCDPSKYSGPLEFRMIIREPDSSDIVMDKTWVSPDSAVLNTGVAFNWQDAFPHSTVRKLRYEIWVNPNRKILETNYDNNRRSGYLYPGGVPFLYSVASPFLPELEDRPRPQSIMRNRYWVHNAILAGACWYYDPDDPDTNVLMVDMTLWIENPAAEDLTVQVALSCDSMFGPSRYSYDVPVAAGDLTVITKTLAINLQDENYIRIQINGRMALDLALRFPGLPYDPTASFTELSVMPNQHYAGSNGGIFNFSIRGGDSPWHITSDDPAFQPQPDTLDDNSNFSHFWDGNGYFFQVIVPPHSTPKMVNYIIKDALNHTVAARLWIFPSR